MHPVSDEEINNQLADAEFSRLPYFYDEVIKFQYLLLNTQKNPAG